MIYPIKRKIKESKMMTEGLKQSSIEGWLRDSVAAMTADEELTISRYFIDNNFGFYVFWSDGFDPNDDSVIHATAEPSFALVCGLKIRNDAEWDGDYMDSPYDPKTGDLYVEDIDIPVNDNYKNIAEWLIEDYNTVQQLLANGEIIAKINESCEKIYTKKNGDYLTKCDNGGHSAFNAHNVFLGHIDDEDAREASFKFEKNKFDESKSIKEDISNDNLRATSDGAYEEDEYTIQDFDIYWKDRYIGSCSVSFDNDINRAESYVIDTDYSELNTSRAGAGSKFDDCCDTEDMCRVILNMISDSGVLTESKSIKESYVEVDYICDGTTNFRIVGGGFNTDAALVSVEDENGKRSRLSTSDVIEFYSWYDKKGNIIREPEDLDDFLTEAPDNYGLPTDDELETKYRAELDKARSERDLLQNAHEQELFDSSFLEELEDWLKKFTDMNKDAEYADIVKNNPDLFNCNDFELGILIDTHKKAITWLTYAIKALKGNKYYYHKWASAPFVYYTGGYGSPVGLVRRNVKAIFKEIPSYFSHLVDLVNDFHRVAYARGGGSDGGYSKVLTALVSDERVDYKLSTFEKFKDWLDNNGIFIKQRYNFKYNQASWNEFIVTSISNSAIQLNRLKSFDTICAKFASEFPGWTLHFSRIQNGSDRGKVRGSFSRDDRQYTNYTDTDYENDIVTDDTVEPAAIKSNADVNNANIVTIVKDSGKLRAQADDGEHGVAFVAFPNNLRNTEGQRYKVDKLIWNGKNYRASGNIEAINESKHIKESPEVLDWDSTDSLSADMEDKRVAYSVVVFPEEGKHGKHTKVFDDIEEAKDFADSVYPNAYSVVIRREEARGRFSGPAVIRRNGLWNDARKVNEAADATKAKEIKEGFTAREILDQAKALLEK